MTTRVIAVFLAAALIAGCSSVGPLLPGVAPGVNAPQGVAPDRGGDVRALVRVHVPRRTRSHAERPSTISPSTKSFSIIVNSTAAQIFNTTPATPGCVAGATGLTCTFAVRAKPGNDMFTVTTYSGVNATGTALDRGITALIPISKGKANHVAVKLGPLVTNALNTGVGSLRYAVASANAGDTIMFALAKGAVITLASPITIAGSVTIAGPGASSLTISGGNAHQIFSISGTATISGLTLTHGKAASTTPGGAIYNVGSLTLTSDVFGGSTSIVAIRRIRTSKPSLRIVSHGLHPHCTATTADGGAIYNDGTLAISGTMFTGNVVRSVPGCVTGQGGAIFNDTLGTLTSTGDTYTNNAAESGGAIYSAADGATSFTNDTFTANTGCTATNGCPTTGCTATSCTGHAVGAGAAIYDHGLGVTVINSTFTNNVAGGPTAGSVGQGGAIALDANSAFPTITGSTFTGNVAGGGTTSCSQGAGGAIVAVNSIELDSDTFKNNSSTGDQTSEGGAVVAQAALTGTNDTFTGNKAVASGGACNSSADGFGGAIFAGGDVTLANSTFTSNTASANYEGAGGAIAAAANLTLNKDTFTSNTATATGAGGASNGTAAGGAAYAATLLKVTSSTFTSNAVSLTGTTPSQALGGAVVTGGSMVSTNSTYASNSVKQTNGATGTAAGGGAAILSGTWISNGDKITSNSVTGPATVGAGGAILGSGGCLVSNATVTSNTVKGGASGGVGGGIAVGASCQITHVAISGNSASSTAAAGIGAGGGLLDTGGSTILNSTITGNTAKTQGGGILSEATLEQIKNSTVSGNTVTTASAASSGGGGIFETNGVFLVQSTIANNSVTVSGPGPAGGGGLFDTGGIIALYSTISGNKVIGSAPNSGGGGIFTTSNVSAIDVTIGNNSSSENGGGINSSGSATASFGNTTIYKNSATHDGGNANIGASAMISLTNSIFAGGTAAVGKDANNAGTFTSNGENIIGSPITGYTPASGDLANTDPKLLGLANNGGPTFTFADQAPGVSPGTQHIVFSGGKCGTLSITVDQRNFTRGAGGKCDVGAYEYAGVATAIRIRPALGKAHFARATTPSRVAFPKLKPVKIEVHPL